MDPSDRSGADPRPDLAEEELETFQRVKCLNNGGYQLQNQQMATDVENNITVSTHPLETTVLIIQHDWQDFLQTQDILEKRSPSPPSLSSDKMSTSISMATLSDGSTPVLPQSPAIGAIQLSPSPLSPSAPPLPLLNSEIPQRTCREPSPPEGLR